MNNDLREEGDCLVENRIADFKDMYQFVHLL